MADLDDFFAKKDKKKAKGKKYTTTDQLAKKLEETGKKTNPEKPKKEKEKPAPVIVSESEDLSTRPQFTEDDEWREFEEEKKDYSGLKIQHLQIADQEEVCEEDGDEEEGSEDGEGRPRREGTTGPWKKVDSGKAPAQDEEEQETAAPAPSTESRGSSTYVPPSKRNQVSSSAQSSHASRRSKAAPDISNEMYFPSLSASASNEPVGAWSRRSKLRGDMDADRFEEVRNSRSHSNRGAEGGRISGTPRLALGNKYSALADSDQS